MENDSGEFRSWGVRYHPGIPYSAGLDCPDCLWDLVFSEEQYKQVVGFSLGDPFGGWKFGAVIIECPQCFKRFWFHVREVDNAVLLRNICPKWPKLNPS